MEDNLPLTIAVFYGLSRSLVDALFLTITNLHGEVVLPEQAGAFDIAMIAVPAGAERKIIHPADWVKSPNPYSYAIRTGDTLFLSGLVPRNGRDNTAVGGDIAAQTKAVMDNAGELLKAAGMDFSHIVSGRVYLPDAANFQGMNTVYRSYFPSEPPARATVIAGLAGQGMVPQAEDRVLEAGTIGVLGQHGPERHPVRDHRRRVAAHRRFLRSASAGLLDHRGDRPADQQVLVPDDDGERDERRGGHGPHPPTQAARDRQPAGPARRPRRATPARMEAHRGESAFRRGSEAGGLRATRLRDGRPGGDRRGSCHAGGPAARPACAAR